MRIQFLPVPPRNPLASTVLATAGQVSSESPVPLQISAPSEEDNRSADSRNTSSPLGIQKKQFQSAVLHKLSQSLVSFVLQFLTLVLLYSCAYSFAHIQTSTIIHWTPRSIELAGWTILGPVLCTQPSPHLKPPRNCPVPVSYQNTPTLAGVVTLIGRAERSFMQ